MFSLLDEPCLRNRSATNVSYLRMMQIFLHGLPWQCFLISFRIIQDKQHDEGESAAVMLGKAMRLLTEAVRVHRAIMSLFSELLVRRCLIANLPSEGI